MSNIVIFVLIYLVPLVPACVFLLGRKGQKNPDATVQGKILGFTINLSGGIAAYAAVFLMGNYFVAPHFRAPSARVLHVRGTMQFSAVPPSAADLLLEIHPPDLAVRDGKSFDWPITIVDGTEHIVIHPAGYEGQTIFLSGEAPFGAPNYKRHFDKDGNLIFDDPITFKKTDAPLAQTAGASMAGGQS